MRQVFLNCCLVLLVCIRCSAEDKPTGDHPLTAKDRKELQATLDATITRLDASIKKSPKDVNLYSRRADALFFAGKFKRAVADYDRMVELDASLDSSHWRRGIAWFYAGQFKDAAGQFERYHSFDNVDRENGIWRFFSQHRAYGQKKARQGLLKYEKDDREPFPSVYKLFSGEISGSDVLAKIEKASATNAKSPISKTEKEKRLFYAHLYVGLNHVVHKRKQEAVPHLKKAIANTWGRKAGFGPNYMWHVGRVQFEILRKDDLQ